MGVQADTHHQNWGPAVTPWRPEYGSCGSHTTHLPSEKLCRPSRLPILLVERLKKDPLQMGAPPYLNTLCWGIPCCRVTKLVFFSMAIVNAHDIMSVDRSGSSTVSAVVPRETRACNTSIYRWDIKRVLGVHAYATAHLCSSCKILLFPSFSTVNPFHGSDE